MSSLSIDFETRATVDLRKTGVYPYAMHRHTDIWCMAWSFDGEEPQVWHPGEPLPQRVIDHILAGGEIRAWNAQFERVIWNEIMVKRYGAPRVALEQWVCSAAEAAAMALPRSLDQCARVLGVSQQKDKGGYELMMRMTRPRSVQEDGTPVWWAVKERMDRLDLYCAQDVRTEQAIVPALRRLTPREREVYLLDQRMNDRGITVDVDLVQAAQGIADEGIARANGALSQLTGGDVEKVTDHNGIKRWLLDQGVEAESVSKAAVTSMLSSDLDPEVRQVLELRADAGRSSLAKLKSMVQVVCADHRARGLMLYHGASTGRWTGRLLQPHNFPRGDVADVESYIDYVLAGQYDVIDLFHHPIPVVSSMLRAMMTAAPGHLLVAGDFSAIEARVLNWLAGQQDMVENFRAYDAGDKTRDPYVQNAMRLYGIPFEQVKKFPHRQTGKFQELGCGYGMGAKKAVSAAKDVYQLIITPEQAKDIVDSYRSTHAQVVDFWYSTNNACIHAVENPGTVVTFGGLRNLRAVKTGAYLYIVLPSGRPLCYAAPSVVMEPPPWGGEDRPSLHFWGVDPYSNGWGELRAYGGLLVENIVQAVSRDLMAEAKLRCEEAGYIPLLSVHDEVISEVPEDFGTVEEFEALLSALPTWAEGCPVAAEGWKGFRYRK